VAAEGECARVVEHKKRGAHRVGCRHQSQARTVTVPMVARVPSSVASMVLLLRVKPAQAVKGAGAGVLTRTTRAASCSKSLEPAPPPVNIAALTAVSGSRELGKDTCRAEGDTMRAATRCPETPARSTPLHCYRGNGPP
jgi:hypothetical protein